MCGHDFSERFPPGQLIRGLLLSFVQLWPLPQLCELWALGGTAIEAGSAHARGGPEALGLRWAKTSPNAKHAGEVNEPSPSASVCFILEDEDGWGGGVNCQTVLLQHTQCQNTWRVSVLMDLQ